MFRKTFIIAEAGVNHDGSLKKAFDLVDAAKEIKVDAIKFQTWKTENIVIKKSFKAPDGTVITKDVELFTWEKLDYVDQVKVAFGL